MTVPTESAERLPRVIIKSRRAQPFFYRHPWVFAGAVKRMEGTPSAGDAVDLYSGEGKFIARGLYNPHSNIRVRLYTWDSNVTLDADFWRSRIDTALALRESIQASNPPADRNESAERLIYSEGDELSGLVVDRYGRWLMVQFTSLAMYERREIILNHLRERLNPQGIWLRTEKGIRDAEGLEVADGSLDGNAPPRPITIDEHGLKFQVDVVEGQKTGTFLDQRDNRIAAAKYMSGRRVLDVFCYTGGFGIAALRHGNAQHVTAVDVSEGALQIAAANAELNGVSDQIEFEKSIAFDFLESAQANDRTFDAVVLDPPKMTRNRSGIDKALKGYHSLNRLAVERLTPGGILVTNSCSGLVNRDEFAGMLVDVALRAGRTLQILESRGQSPDHPISVFCPETAYLKCFICRVV
ncbi:class I SAM-dependent rRNA methyltransferase [Thalassoroseus pseudoceratinae]|uniref:class I SAM-dependent rRNA methyltransferase n=1 Tax=Thalassoroseus pseudoceratinae TaxID=2713176 RepID=UPI00141FEB99|nr:class I SAM-dependent rRNA methyltransferase [Thalassoroseus pseudoceratinae]